ncbi:melatonin receptor type 1A-like [Oculina patagonica]
MAEERDDTRSLTTVAIHTIILVLSTILTFAGNSLVCLALYRNRRLRTVTNTYVLSLAATDLVASMFVFPFNTIASGLRRWPFNFSFCQFNGFISYFWGAMTVNILALTAVNRYICIVKPNLYTALFTRKKSLFSILLLLLLSLGAFFTAIFATPIFFQWFPIYLVSEVTGLKIRAGVSRGIVGFVALMMSLMTFCYGSVYRAIRLHNTAVNPSLQAATSQRTVSAHEIQASRVLLAAVIGFGVCWIPMTVIRAINIYAHSPLPSFWLSYSTLFAFFSSWINPIIYGVMNRAMRREFLKLLRCGRKN